MSARLLRAGMALALCAPLSGQAAVFINELHYDDSTAAGDTGEAIEVVATAGETLTGYSIVLYNGSTPGAATVYDTDALPAGSLVTCGAQVRIATLTYPTNGIQNGGNDGIALIGPGNAVVQFVSYEGTATASGGPAAGLTSTDIGVSEGGTTAAGTSLQLNGANGTQYSSFAWSGSATQTFGACNTSQTFASLVDNPPELSSTTPADGATGVAVDAAIELAFTESVTTTPDPWFALTCGGNPVAATATGSGGTRTITPNAPLPFGTACALALDETRILDTDGTPHALVAGTLGYTDFGFTTAVDTAPTVTGIVPADGAAGVAATTNVTLTFSESVTVPAMAADWITLTCGGTGVGGAVIGGGATYVFDPATTLTPAAVCEVQLDAADIRDIDGTPDALAGAANFDFTVAADVAPSVSSTYPTDNATNVPPGDDFTVTFTEAVDATAQAFVLECPADTPVALSSSTLDGLTWTLDPGAELPSDTDCVLTVVASQIADRDGTPTSPAADTVIDFTTGLGLAAYYERVDASSCRTLRATLHGVIDDHYAVVYSDTGDTWTPGQPNTYDVWEVLNLADEDPLDPGKILDVYKNVSYTKISGGTGAYNREHTWPNSHGFNDVDFLDGGPFAPYTDTHMLMASDSTYNSNRSNRAYAICNPAVTASCVINPTSFNAANNDGGGSTTYNTMAPNDHNWVTPGTDGGNGSYEVWDGRRGDVARGMLYMDVRYEGGTNARTGQRETDLILTDTRSQIVATPNGVFQTVGYSGLLTPLLAWAQQDVVTAREGLRNDVVESVQRNRNPFVDHPEWIATAFANPCNGPVVVAVDDDFTTATNTMVVGAAPGMLRDDRNGTNKNGEGLTATISVPAANGTAVLTNAATGAFTYTPNNGFCGTDSFGYTASNGVESDSGMVHIAVGSNCGGNAQPVANDATFMLAENSANGTAVGTVTASDADAGQTLAYAIIGGNTGTAFAIDPATGAITVATQAALNFETTPTFSLAVRVTDNGTPAASDVATVTITLTNVDEGAAVAADDSVTVNEDSGANVLNVLGNDTVDPDTNSIAVTAVTTAQHGTTGFTAGNVSYTPAANYCGADSFGYTVSGGDTATVSVTVTCVGDAPTVVGTLPDRSFVAGSAIAAFATSTAFSSPDAVMLFEADNLPPGLAISLTTGDISGTPTTPGVYVVTARAVNPHGSAETTFAITITSPPDTGSAVANDDQATVGEDAAATVIEVLANDTADPDSGLIAVTGVSGAAHGSTTFTAGNVSYTPAANYCGADSFTYTVSGGDVATVAVTVSCVTDAPTLAGTLPDRFAVVDRAIAAFGTASGFAGVDAYTLRAEGLPAGVTMDAAGNVSGTPTVAGEFVVTVFAENAGGTVNNGFTLVVGGLPIFADGFED